MRRSSTLKLALLSAAALLGGCKGCDHDKPYTPFGITSALPNLASAAPSASAAPAFAPHQSELAPAGAKQWDFGGQKLSAPHGRVFEQALSADFNGDGKPDAVAWTLPAKAAPGVAAGELWYYPSGGKPARLESLPGFVPTAPSCKLSTTLSQTGEHSVTLDAGATCGAGFIARSPVRSIAVVEPGRAHPILLELRAAAPPDGESLKLAIDSSDRDKDGRDDVDLTVTVKKDGSPRPASAHMVWLDRAAGPSREADEPRHSFDRIASLELIRSKGKHTSRSVADGVGNEQRLISVMCDEYAVPRLFDRDGNAFRCGKLALAESRMALAELQAALTQGHVAEAFAVLDRSAASGKTHDKMVKALDKAVTALDVSEVLTPAARPVPRDKMPRWSPLRFEPTGALLVQTPAGLVRVAPDGHDELPIDAEAGVASWALPVTASDGRRWTGIANACDRPEVLLLFNDARNIPMPPVATRLLAPRPGTCRGGKPPRVPAAAPLSWRDGRGLSAIVAGSRIGPEPGKDVVPGSPRSPDGKLLVVPTSRGLLVTGGDKPELWKRAGLDPLALTDCVVDNGARSIACVEHGHVKLLRRP